MIQFEENQRFKELTIYILSGLLQSLFLWGFIQQVIFNKPWGTRPAGDLAFIYIIGGATNASVKWQKISLRVL